MLKTEAIHLLGGSIKSAAKQIGITTQAIGGWPDQLTPAIRDRVQAALWRQMQEGFGTSRGASPTPASPIGPGAMAAAMPTETKENPNVQPAL